MRVRSIVDLSVPVLPDTQVYPGDPQPLLTPHATIARDGFNLLALHLGSQTGTHVDAPFHVRRAGTTVDELDLRLCTGPASVVDVRGLGPREPITWDRIAPARLERIVLIHTGWSLHYGTSAYFDHPFLDVDAVRRMLTLGVRTFCIDAPSVDPTTDNNPTNDSNPTTDNHLPAHLLIADAGGVIGENFRNLDLVDWPDPFLSCLPIKLAGADGAPVRAVALRLSDGDGVETLP